MNDFSALIYTLRCLISNTMYRIAWQRNKKRSTISLYNTNGYVHIEETGRGKSRFSQINRANEALNGDQTVVKLQYFLDFRFIFIFLAIQK